ncbi:hypothetical protein [Microvirgula aerodenitrificans]|uniref:hypothetical protein n=1 Tax=Microvirgula aerodenitrificans TaxID=57480 RepID=UPI00248E9B17|nr:hypothetical protein [Microvirgula aerodenitrificans]
MMTEKDSLVYGIEYPAGSGTLHYDFEVMMPTIGINVRAMEQHPDASAIVLTVAMMAACLVRIGDIPRDAITFELLDGELDPEDYDVVNAVWSRLKKKRMRPSAGSPASGEPSLSLAATDSTKTVSAA